MDANNSNISDFTPQTCAIKFIDNIFSWLYNIERCFIRVRVGGDKKFSKNINKIIY
jgi:hypothetical protein